MMFKVHDNEFNSSCDAPFYKGQVARQNDFRCKFWNFGGIVLTISSSVHCDGKTERGRKTLAGLEPLQTRPRLRRPEQTYAAGCGDWCMIT